MQTLDDCPTYLLRGPAGQRPKNLHTHMAQYALHATVLAYDLCPGDKRKNIAYDIPPSGSRLSGVPTALLAGLNRIVIGLTNLAMKVNGTADLPAIAAEAQVCIIAKPYRLNWAELVLCKWAVREGWEVQPTEGRTWIDPSNPKMAHNNPRAPLPLMIRINNRTHKAIV